MIPSTNPFRARASEQLQDDFSFVHTFGPQATHWLPDPPWDRLLVLRSAPGAGKTSLMRLMEIDTLRYLHRIGDPGDALWVSLNEMGVLTDDGPAFLGLRVDLSKGYRSLLDIESDHERSRRLLFRLVDARVVSSYLRACLSVGGDRLPEGLERLELRPVEDAPAAEAVLSRFGDTTGTALWEWAAASERQILDAMDSLTPADAAATYEGHAGLYSLRLLAVTNVFFDGEPIELTPLVMFDDGHALAREQREDLIRELTARDTGIPRWYAERYEALEPEELLSVIGTPGRDYELVVLEEDARRGSVRGDRRGRARADRALTRQKYEAMLMDIANRRAGRWLDRYSHERREFVELLSVEPDELLGDAPQRVHEAVRKQLYEAAGGEKRYERWLEPPGGDSLYERTVELRAREIIIHRDRARSQLELFDSALPAEELDSRTDSRVREAAAVALAKEHGLPYYVGPDDLARLGSYNIEQFLRLCGDLFADMLVDISLGRSARMSARRQSRIVTDSSVRLWREINERVPGGGHVQRFIRAIAAMARDENDSPRVSYAPGVTGTALSTADQERLLDPGVREEMPGAQKLFQAIVEAVRHNLIWVEDDRPVKSDRYMVIYLNRLLCPLFDLPLGRGGFREKPLETMCEWMEDPPRPIATRDQAQQLALSP